MHLLDINTLLCRWTTWRGICLIGVLYSMFFLIIGLSIGICWIMILALDFWSLERLGASWREVRA